MQSKKKSKMPKKAVLQAQGQQQQSSSSSTRRIWFILVDASDGTPYKGSTADKVSLASDADVADLRDAVKADYSSMLSSVDAGEVLVYKNKVAFDKRNAVRDEEKEDPLEEDSSIYDLGNCEEEALVVAVPSSLENQSVSSGPVTFVEYLERGQIHRPDQQVLDTIVNRYSQQLSAALQVGSVRSCINLYNKVKELPTPFTLGVIQRYMDISMGGPISLAQPNILVAVDLKYGKHLFMKLLRIPQTITSQSSLSKEDAVSAEIDTCTRLTEANIPGLVKSDVVEITVRHSEDVSPTLWAALKMKRYMSSLADLPQLSEDWLYRGFSRILNALKAMHEMNLVHMDVKSDNVFVDEHFQWDLGDFGSTRKVGTPIWSYTEVVNPYDIPTDATVIPAMDYVLLCVMIAIILKIDRWKDLCGQYQIVQERLIIEKLKSIKDVDFKTQVTELFEDNLKTVRDHLRKF